MQKNVLQAGLPRITLQNWPAKSDASTVNPRTRLPLLWSEIDKSYLSLLLLVLEEPNASIFALNRRAGLIRVPSTSLCACLVLICSASKGYGPFYKGYFHFAF